MGLLIQQIFHNDYDFHKKWAARLFSTVINVTWAPNQDIRMISEKLNTKDWSDDAKNWVLP